MRKHYHLDWGTCLDSHLTLRGLQRLRLQPPKRLCPRLDGWSLPPRVVEHPYRAAQALDHGGLGGVILVGIGLLDDPCATSYSVAELGVATDEDGEPLLRPLGGLLG